MPGYDSIIIVSAARTPLGVSRASWHPAPLGLRPFGLPDDESPSALVRRNPLADALSGLVLGLRSRDFYVLAGTFFICGATTNVTGQRTALLTKRINNATDDIDHRSLATIQAPKEVTSKVV